MADIAKGQEAGGGEGPPPSAAAANATASPETKPAAAEETKATEGVKSVITVPSNAPVVEEVKASGAASLEAVAVQASKPTEAVATAAEGLAKLAETVAKLQEAVAKPAETGANPEEALVKPEETVANPVEIVAKPEEAAAKLVETATTPTPEEAVAKPEVPVANSDNAQAEKDLDVEEYKSNANPVNIDVVPEQVLVQEILTAATAKADAMEQSKEVKAEAQPSVTTEASTSTEDVNKEVTSAKESGDWQQREQELLQKIEQLETVKTGASEDRFKLELKIREEEIELLKARVKNLETELQAALSKPGGKNQEIIEKIKQQHEELLSRARGMIFDKTKVVKNQELQIEALNTQILSLKDINTITKDLLEIRNSEVKAMEERLQVMESRFKTEKERYDLVLKRAATSTNINDDLRKEYETQLKIFKELREKYEQRVQALVAENNRLKESLQGGSAV